MNPDLSNFKAAISVISVKAINITPESFIAKLLEFNRVVNFYDIIDLSIISNIDPNIYSFENFKSSFF